MTLEPASSIATNNAVIIELCEAVERAVSFLLPTLAHSHSAVSIRDFDVSSSKFDIRCWLRFRRSARRPRSSLQVVTPGRTGIPPCLASSRESIFVAFSVGNRAPRSLVMWAISLTTRPQPLDAFPLPPPNRDFFSTAIARLAPKESLPCSATCLIAC